MLNLDFSVPDALLLPKRVTDLREHLSKAKAHWFTMSPEWVDADDSSPNSISTLRSCTTAAHAERTIPHAGSPFENYKTANARLEFRAGHHCGYTVPGPVDTIQDWSYAIRFQADSGEALTLLTLNFSDSNNYVFLQHVGGAMTFQDRKGTFKLSTPFSSDHDCLVVAGQSDGQFWLRVNNETVASETHDSPDLAGPSHLFIGCRSQRAGLKKKLGTFELTDVIFWPDRNVLKADHEMTVQALDLLGLQG